MSISWQTNDISDTEEIVKLSPEAQTLRENDYISPDLSSYSFPMNFGQKAYRFA